MNWRTKLQEQRGAIFQERPGDPLTKLTKPQKGQFDPLTKLTQPSFVGSVSDPPKHSENIAETPADALKADHRRVIVKFRLASDPPTTRAVALGAPGLTREEICADLMQRYHDRVVIHPEPEP